jgi:hypothetical protein
LGGSEERDGYVDGGQDAAVPWHSDETPFGGWLRGSSILSGEVSSLQSGGYASAATVGLTKCAFSWKFSQRVQVLGAEGEQASLLEVLDLHPQRIDHCRSHLASPGRTVDRRELLRFRLELRELFLAVPVLLVVADHTFTSSLAVPQRARPARVPRGRRGRIARRADRIPAP